MFLFCFFVNKTFQRHGQFMRDIFRLEVSLLLRWLIKSFKCYKPEKKLWTSNKQTVKRLYQAIQIYSLTLSESNIQLCWTRCIQIQFSCFMTFTEKKTVDLEIGNNYLNQRWSWRKICIHSDWKTSGKNFETFTIRFGSRSIIESTKLAVIKQTPGQPACTCNKITLWITLFVIVTCSGIK